MESSPSRRLRVRTDEHGDGYLGHAPDAPPGARTMVFEHPAV
jgi:hypothetical protein